MRERVYKVCDGKYAWSTMYIEGLIAAVNHEVVYVLTFDNYDPLCQLRVVSFKH